MAKPKTASIGANEPDSLESYLKTLPADLAQLISAFAYLSLDMQSQFPKYLSGIEADKNKYGEVVAKLDQWANGTLCDAMMKTGLVRSIHSEELEQPIHGSDAAPFVLTFDPLDGSSNIVSNNPFGIIMGVWRDDLPQSGRKLTAAVAKLYGPVNTLILSNGFGVHEFVKHYDSDGRAHFILLHKNLKLPSSPEVFGIGGDPLEWDAPFLPFAKDLFRKEKLRVRYCGSFVSDFSQVLHRGGFFAYPSSKKSPGGKFRLYYECIPLSFLIEEAGGASFDGSSGSILDHFDADIDARVPLYFGNKALVAKLKAALGKK